MLEVLLSDTGPSLALEMGRANGSLAVSSLSLPSRFGADDQIARTRRYARRLGRLVPTLDDRVRNLIERLVARHRSRPNARTVPLHGSPHAHQWLHQGDGLSLVDFDRAARGHPEIDVATFMTEMDYEDERWPRDAISAAYRRGYESVAGPLDDLLLATYCAHKHVSKALKAARSLRPDGVARAAEALGRGFAAIGASG